MERHKIESRVVDLKDVFVAYETTSGKVMALRGINFCVKEGETIVINGPSGSGKTTLLKLILGLVKPISGKVYVFGMNPFIEDNARKIRREIAYCSQEGLFIKQLTIYENVELYLCGRNKKVPKTKINNLAKQLDINNVLDKFPDQLSGGELKRAELLMVLINKPKLLLLDEPTAMLDAENVERIINVLRQYLKSATTVIATHDIRLNDLGHKIINLVGGRITDVICNK